MDLPPVVSADWWAANAESVVTADVRWYLDGRSGRVAYDGGHLPGAVFVDLDDVLAAHDRPGSGRHPLPDPDAFAQGLAALGVGDHDAVVAYDDAGGVIAARLVWMLRAIGHPAALLDGGLAAYDGPLSTEPVTRPSALFSVREWPAARIAGLAEVTDRRHLVIDARDRDRYRGDHEPVDPRAGHVPGAINRPCRENLTAAGTFVPVAELRERFVSAGVDPETGDEVISYCGSGVTACHNLLALEYAGLGLGRLYPGSWSAYSSDPANPAATGDEPG